MTVPQFSETDLAVAPLDWPPLTDSHDYLPFLLLSSKPDDPEHGDPTNGYGRPQTPTRGTAYECIQFSQELPMPSVVNDMLHQPQPFKAKPIVSMEQIMADDCGQPTPHFQPPRSQHDQYTPVWTRGSGSEREGRCAVCQPPVWLKLKQSAYWYHMNYVHGICASTGRPYPEPLRYRISLGRNSDMVKCEGWCGECRAWKGVGSRSREEVSSALDCLDGDYLNLTTLNLSTDDYKSTFPHTNWYKHCQKQHKNNF